MYDYYLNRDEEKDMVFYQNIVCNNFINGEEVRNVAELVPIDGHKSFCGRAKVINTGNHYYLLSYTTIVCGYDMDNRTFVRYWDDYSVTTMRHINSFMRYIGFNLGGKKWWTSLDCNKQYTISELVNI